MRRIRVRVRRIHVRRIHVRCIRVRCIRVRRVHRVLLLAIRVRLLFLARYNSRVVRPFAARRPDKAGSRLRIAKANQIETISVPAASWYGARGS